MLWEYLIICFIIIINLDPPRDFNRCLGNLEGAHLAQLWRFHLTIAIIIGLKACSFETEPCVPFVTIHLSYHLSVHFLLLLLFENAINYIQMAVMKETFLSFLINKADQWALKPWGSSICCNSRIPAQVEDEINRRRAVCCSTFVQVWHMHTSLATIFEKQDQGGEEESGSD